MDGIFKLNWKTLNTPLLSENKENKLSDPGQAALFDYLYVSLFPVSEEPLPRNAVETKIADG